MPYPYEKVMITNMALIGILAILWGLFAWIIWKHGRDYVTYAAKNGSHPIASWIVFAFLIFPGFIACGLVDCIYSASGIHAFEVPVWKKWAISVWNHTISVFTIISILIWSLLAVAYFHIGSSLSK